MPKVDESNARTIWIVDALKSAVQDPTYQVLLPWLHPSTWDSVVSPVDCIRNGLRVVGRKCLGYCLLLAFFDVADGLEAGSLPGHYETVEECLLREDVLVEILRKVKSPGIQPIASRGTAVRGPFLVFLGGLWQDTCSLDKMTPWIFMVFVPLIRVALKAYNEFRPGETQRKAKRARASVPDAGEIQMLQRMKNLQLAKKPAKPTTLSIQDVAGTSSDSSDDDDEEEDESTREESASTSSSSASSVTPPRHGRGKTRPWTSAFVLPVDPGALLPPSAGALPPPFTLEGVVEDKPSEREETGVAGPNRSPLTPRNLKDARAGSASPSGFGARVSLFPDRSPTQSSPSDCPSSPASLVSSFKENLLLG